jgi:hypothetical protein
MARVGFSIDWTTPPTANCVLSVADDADCAAAVGLETDCATPPSHATVARLAVIINTAHVRVMVPRFLGLSGRFHPSRSCASVSG